MAVAGDIVRNWAPPPADKPVPLGVPDFILRFFVEDTTQRPGFNRGFWALSRAQLQLLADNFELPINLETSKDILVPLLNAYFQDDNHPEFGSATRRRKLHSRKEVAMQRAKKQDA